MTHPHFSVFRVMCALGLAAIAIWLFMGGHLSGPNFDAPSWLLETPAWLLGSVFLAARSWRLCSLLKELKTSSSVY